MAPSKVGTVDGGSRITQTSSPYSQASSVEMCGSVGPTDLKEMNCGRRQAQVQILVLPFTCKKKRKINKTMFYSFDIYKQQSKIRDN